jgi:hypothetical protein
MYIGDGKFVHASSGGGKVQVNNLHTGYYASRYAGATRPKGAVPAKDKDESRNSRSAMGNRKPSSPSKSSEDNSNKVEQQSKAEAKAEAPKPAAQTSSPPPVDTVNN